MYFDDWSQSYHTAGYMTWQLAKVNQLTGSAPLNNSDIAFSRAMLSLKRRISHMKWPTLEASTWPTTCRPSYEDATWTWRLRASTMLVSYNLHHFIFFVTLTCAAGRRKLANFRRDFSNDDLRRCGKRIVDSTKHMRIACQFQINFGAKKGVLHFVCLYGGKETGRTQVTFDRQDSVAGVGETVATSCSLM